MLGRPVRIIIDTNLWISFLIGLKSSPAVRNILTDGMVSIVMTDILRQEIMTVASRPKFARYFSPEACDRLLSFLHARSEDYILGDIPQRCRDPKDDYLLELARVADADILVTGDKDLTDMHQFGRCWIMTLAEFKSNFCKPPPPLNHNPINWIMRSTSGRLLPTGRKNIKNNHNMKTVNFWRAAMMLPVMLLTTATA